jgi:hypothetical protein
MLDTHDPTNKTRYYGWEYDEKWKTCFRNYNQFFITLGTTIDRNNDIIDRQNIITINESTNKLYIRYTILAKQYSFSENTYKYLKELIKQNLNQGSLYDVIPNSPTSNVRCLTNKNEPVVGYFVVAGATEKRIFIDRSELPKAFVPITGYNDCETKVLYINAALKDYREDLRLDSLMRQGFAIYDSVRTLVCTDNPPPGIPCKTMLAIQMMLAKTPCFNCTVTGYNNVPAFWKE